MVTPLATIKPLTALPLSAGQVILGALIVAALVGLAEWLHARRVARVARLAFGATGAPRPWARAVPILRSLAAGMVAWGLGTLASLDPVEVDTQPARNASKHLLLCFDASPSMHIADAGPERDKVSRAIWGGKVVQGILDRLDMETTRVTVVAFYTDALPVVRETFDKEVIRNILDGLPMYAAFQPGGTDVSKGIAEAIEIARPWPKQSTLLVVVSDGDSAAGPPPGRLPSSIADSLVIGIGDPNRSTTMWGRPSRQDVTSLRQVAARLGGRYHDGNQKHLPSAVLDELTLIQPRPGSDLALRDAALFATGVGAFTLAFATPLLQLAGRRRWPAAAASARPAGDAATPRTTVSPVASAAATTVAQTRISHPSPSTSLGQPSRSLETPA
jgi:Ca-activated chloride channel homolog